MAVWLKTLGPLSVTVDGEEKKRLLARPLSVGVLVFLGLEREAARDRLLGLFWPETPQERARHALSQALYDLRKDLGTDWLETPGGLLRTTPALQVDVHDFQRLADEGRLEEAVALYSGPFLEGMHLTRTHAFEEWVEHQRGRLARRHRAAADALITSARDRGDLRGALQAAWRWVGLDPLDDGGQHHLIRLLAESGSRSEALAHYERYEGLLREELGLDPLDETRELVEAIRTGSVNRLPSGDEEGGASTEAAVSASGVPDVLQGPEGAQTGSVKGIQRLLEQELEEELRIIRPIGGGKAAVVYLAAEPHLKRMVAVKVLSPALSSDPVARARFEREAQAAARLNHPHVCTVYRVGSLSDGTPYLVMPFIRGTSLDHRLKTLGRLPVLEVRRLLREVSSALAAAHDLGLIHRDVRPANVLQEEETGRYLLCDFGLAGIQESAEEAPSALTDEGEILGSPAYMSPEQTKGERLVDRTDVFSLGVMAHQLLTGRLPSLAKGRIRLATADRHLANIVRACLELDPRDRPSAGEIADLLDASADGPLTLRAPPTPQRLPELRSLLTDRRFHNVIGGYLAGSVVAVGFVALLVHWHVVPDIAVPLTLNTAAFGLLAVAVAAWFSSEGGDRARVALEPWLLALVALAWAVVSVVLLF